MGHDRKGSGKERCDETLKGKTDDRCERYEGAWFALYGN